MGQLDGHLENVGTALSIVVGAIVGVGVAVAVGRGLCDLCSTQIISHEILTTGLWTAQLGLVEIPSPVLTAAVALSLTRLRSVIAASGHCGGLGARQLQQGEGTADEREDSCGEGRGYAKRAH